MILTELSRPSVSSMRKKIKAQNGAPGKVEIASGYATNTNPGPREQNVKEQPLTS